MLKFFNKDVSDEKVNQFVKWFFENENKIRKSVENSKNDREKLNKISKGKSVY